MVRQRHRIGWWAAFLTLVVIVFAVSPSVEAAACAGETSHAQVTATSDSGDDHDDGAQIHGLCGHGHSHHTAAALNNSLSSFSLFDPTSLTYGGLPDTSPPLHVPGGLERPPRG